MTCDRIEELLPAFADDDLSKDERLVVESHLGECASCRETLAFLADLEGALVKRRELRPSPHAAADRVMGRVGLATRGWVLRSLIGLPGLVSVLLITIGVLWLQLSNRFMSADSSGGRLSGQFESSVDGVAQIAAQFVGVIEWLRDSLILLAAGNEWTLLAIYMGLAALVVLSGSWMVVRFSRD